MSEMRIQSYQPVSWLPPSGVRESSPVQNVQSAPDDPKTRLIESMIREVPDDASKKQLVRALSFMPTEALARVAEYGTRLEVYDRRQVDPPLPLYAQHLRKPNLSGAYSPTANVVFVDLHNITPLVLLHEFSHALDCALGNPSQSPEWQSARDTSRATRVCIRPYATHNSAEYFADNLAAHLIPDNELPALLAHDWQNGINTAGLQRTEFLANHVNYSHGRQQRADSAAYGLVQKLLQKLPEMPAAPPRPALTPDQYRAVKVAELRARKLQDQKSFSTVS